MKKAKIMFALGIVAGLSAVSAKACDGPVVVPGYTAGSCDCHNDTSSCQPSGLTIGYRNTYTTCGGDGYDSCTTENQTVGYENPGCDDTSDLNELALLQSAYDDCLRQNNGQYDPPIICTPPKFCDWNTCTMATSGGTPLNRDVEVSLGDACGA